MIKHTLNIFVVLVISFLFVLSGCEKQSEEVVEEIAPSEISFDEVEEVSVGFWEIYEPQSEAAIFLSQYIEDNFKIKIKPITFTRDNYQSELDWMIGANMLPDVFAHDIIENKMEYKVLITSGLVQSIPKELWAGYERLGAVMGWYENTYAYDGEMFFIPRTYQTFDQTHGATNVILYRIDWAKDLSKNTYGDSAGFIDIIDLLGAYRGSDTDQNTIWDTWGITGSGGIEFIWDMFLTPFGVRDWVLEDGKWIPGIISTDAKEAISWAAQIYREGIIDPAIAHQNSDEALGKFFTGKTGAVLTQAYYENLVYFEKEWEVHNPDKSINKSVKLIPSYTTPKGTINNEVSTFEGGSMISSNVGATKMQKILALYDFMFSNEGRNLFEYGDILGPAEAQSAADFLSASPEFQNFANLASWNLDRNPSSLKADSDFIVYAQNLIENDVWSWSFEEELFTNGMITPEMCVLDVDHIAEEKILQIIKTTRDFDADWESYVESMYSELNLEEAIAEVNERAEVYFSQD